jgi:hypothetical protein
VWEGYQVGWAKVDGSARAALWNSTAESWVNLSAFLPPGFGQTIATAVWSDGSSIRVTGQGWNTLTRQSEALLWTYEIPECLADINASGAIDVDDLIVVILAWGPCSGPPASCPANIVYAGASVIQVDVDDLIEVIVSWGACRS